MKAFIFLFLFLFLDITSVWSRHISIDRYPAQAESEELVLNSDEVLVKEMLERILQTFARYAYRLEIRNSERAMEYHLYYHPSDRSNIIGYAGNRALAIRTLVNESTISLQEKQAAKNNEKFDLKKRKLVFIRFLEETLD